jgi:F-type H+-transporting ATPase subunit b
MNKLLLFAFTICFSFANGDMDISQTDIIPRSINFIIFVAIAYYLLKDKISDFISQRIKSIVKQQERVQNILNESRQEKEMAKKRVLDAEALALKMQKSAEDELVLIRKSIQDSTENDIKNISKQYEDKKSLEKSKIKKSIAKEVIEQIFDDEDILLDDNMIAKMITHKVA